MPSAPPTSRANPGDETLAAAGTGPVWIRSLAGYNVVAWSGQFHAVPKELGPAYLDGDELRRATGVVIAPSLDALVAELGEDTALAAAAAEPPVKEEAPPVEEDLAARTARWLGQLDPTAARNLRFLLQRISETEDERDLVADALQDANSFGEALPRLAELQACKIRSRLRPDQPTVAIYFPSAAYREQAGNLAARLRAAGGNAFTLVGTVCGDRYETGDWVFYGGHDLVRGMEWVDLFVVPTLMDGLPEHARKLLLVHDIYDSPVGDTTAFRKLLAGFDYCVLPSRFVIDLFQSVLAIPDETLERTQPLHLIPGGYLKLDRLIEHFRARRRDEKTLIYAPTVTGLDFQDVISLPQDGAAIVETVLNSFPDYQLIFRPHPHSLNTEPVRRIAGQFQAHPRFTLDDNASFYMDNYARAALMISDISGTAYTYAFATLRPVAFFSPHEAEVQRRYAGLHYVRDRARVGRVVETVAGLPGVIRGLLADQARVKRRIRDYRSKVIFHVGEAEDRLVQSIESILRGEELAEWVAA